jgi:hypothetical protein
MTDCGNARFFFPLLGLEIIQHDNPFIFFFIFIARKPEKKQMNLILFNLSAIASFLPHRDLQQFAQTCHQSLELVHRRLADIQQQLPPPTDADFCNEFFTLFSEAGTNRETLDVASRVLRRCFENFTQLPNDRRQIIDARNALDQCKDVLEECFFSLETNEEYRSRVQKNLSNTHQISVETHSCTCVYDIDLKNDLIKLDYGMGDMSDPFDPQNDVSSLSKKMDIGDCDDDEDHIEYRFLSLTDGRLLQYGRMSEKERNIIVHEKWPLPLNRVNEYLDDPLLRKVADDFMDERWGGGGRQWAMRLLARWEKYHLTVANARTHGDGKVIIIDDRLQKVIYYWDDAEFSAGDSCTYYKQLKDGSLFVSNCGDATSTAVFRMKLLL